MTTRRHLLLLAALITGVALATSTGGVGSMTSDRGAQVAVADDQAAYLGFEQTVSNVENGTAALSVTVTNQFPSGTVVAVEITVDGTTVEATDDGTLEPGEAATRTFQSVPCDDPITVIATSDGVHARLNRFVACDP